MTIESPRVQRLRRSLATLGIFDSAVEADSFRKALFEASFAGLDLSVVEYQTVRDICDLGEIETGPHRTALEAALIALFVARREGSVCVPLVLEAMCERLPAFPEREELIAAFILATEKKEYQSVLQVGGQLSDAEPPEFLPLAVVSENLYFQRYLAAENMLREALAARFGPDADHPEAGSGGRDEALGKHLAEVLSRSVIDPVSGREINPGLDQKLALALALLRSGVIITGGPGTGKTSIVFAMLRVLLRTGIPASRIGLAAPTGRAAQRVGESLRQQFDRLPIVHRIPAEAAIRDIVPATIHRLLGYSPMTLGFRHDRRNPLNLDVIIVDEASMIDVDLMAHLLDAIPPTARVVLLGDADQLPSVEAGAVLADLVRGQRQTQLSDLWMGKTRGLLGTFADKGEASTGTGSTPNPTPLPAPAPAAGRYPDHMIVLRQSFRSVKEILGVAESVNTFPEDASAAEAAAVALIASANSENRQFVLDRDLSDDQGALEKRLGFWIGEFCQPEEGFENSPGFSYIELVQNYHRNRPAPDTTEERRLLEIIFRLIDRRRLLTVFREGPFGSEGINEIIADRLRRRLGFAGAGRFFPGALVMVTRNEYRLELFNGDTGVILPGPRGGLIALFPRHGGYLRVPVDELPAPTLAFAVTVHKSQGSEFEEVTLVVPSSPFGPVIGPAMGGTPTGGAERILTREIIYTGLTRAKKRVTVWTDETAFFAACRRRVKRTSGL